MDTPSLHPWQVFAMVYAASAWCSFGLYCVSDQTWSMREGFARTIHGANAGTICALLGVRWIGFDKPWEVIGIACSTSMGWTKKEDIGQLVATILAKIIK